MTPTDMPMKVKDKVSSFLHLHSDFCYNSLGSTCTCFYLIEGMIVKHLRDVQGRLPPWPPPKETSKGVQVKLEAQIKST